MRLKVKALFHCDGEIFAGEREAETGEEALKLMRSPLQMLDVEDLEELMELMVSDVGEDALESDGWCYLEKMRVRTPEGDFVKLHGRDGGYLNPDNRKKLLSWGIPLPEDAPDIFRG